MIDLLVFYQRLGLSDCKKISPPQGKYYSCFPLNNINITIYFILKPSFYLCSEVHLGHHFLDACYSNSVYHADTLCLTLIKPISVMSYSSGIDGHCFPLLELCSLDLFPCMFWHQMGWANVFSPWFLSEVHTCHSVEL